ncbi:MAG: DUF1580 domain-containing protein [Planctomycetes bacterium]|nr:DUF1580 domain-containing protein [Planctomycetota bacterium]
MFQGDDELIPLRAAARLFPSSRGNGKPVHVATLYRWALRGVRGNKLATVVVGGARYTTRAAVLAWIGELNPSARLPSFEPRPDPERVRRSEEILRRAGILRDGGSAHAPRPPRSAGTLRDASR